MAWRRIAALGSAAAWASGFQRRIAAAGRRAARFWNEGAVWALIAILAVRLSAAAVARPARGRWTIGVVALAVAIATFEYAGRTAVSDLKPHAIASAATRLNVGAEDFASFNKWKKGVEQALNAAKIRERARQQDESVSDSAGAPTQGSQTPQDALAPIDLGIAQEVAGLQAKTLNQNGPSSAANEGRVAAAAETGLANESTGTKGPEQSGQNPVFGTAGAVPMRGFVDPIPSGRLNAQPWRPSVHAWGRGHWRERRHRWAYFRLMGVARSFPYVLSVR